jgi:hypothetical protein
MKKYFIEIQGNDTFIYSVIVKASQFKNAVTLAEEEIEKVSGNTIEQLRIVLVGECQ